MRLALALSVALLAGMAAPALADTYRFDVTDPAAALGSQPFQNYYFLIDSSTAPSSFDVNSFSYDVTDFGTTTFGSYDVLDSVAFYTEANAGGFSNIFTTTFEDGPQAFNGPTSAPTFHNTTYSYDTDQPNGGETLQITDVSAPPVSAAPEPGVWTLIIVGIGLMGAALRLGRRRENSLSAA